MRAFAVFFTFVLGLAGLPANAQEQQLLHQERSLYRNIFVTQTGDERCMLFRYPRPFGRESCKLLHDPDKLIFDYTQMMLSGLYLNPNPKKILVTGEGGATIISALQEMLPDAQIDVVEIDGAVDRVARQYFDFKPGPKTRVTIEDGRVFVKRAAASKPNYDMVLLDAFDADYIPEHMLTREFLNEVKTIMAPNGVIVANTFSNSALYDYESVTYKEAFGTYFNLKLANRIILGRLGGLPQMAEIQANAMKWEAALSKRGTGSEFILPLLDTTPDWNQMARVLTDQYSPSNLLNALPRPK